MQNSLLIEIGTEELPPKQLINLASSLKNSITDFLSNDGFDLKSSTFYAAPRRIAVIVEQINYEQSEKTNLVFGPMVEHAFDDNEQPKPAALGFAKKFNTTIDKLTVSETPKGKRLAFNQTIAGKTLDISIPLALEFAIKQLPQQRWMHWEDKNWLFVRPVHWFVCMHGNNVLKCSLFDKESSNKTFGHRFYANKPIEISSANEYVDTLKEAYVVVSQDERKASILSQIRTLEENNNINAILPEDLLTEINALIEHPKAMLAEFNSDFLQVPKEVLITSMQEHQKCIATIDKNTNELSNKFIVISNMAPKNQDNIISGNERVMNARLSDAAFYFNQDKKTPIEEMANRLESVVFFEKLGTLKDKTDRVSNLAEFFSKKLNADTAATKHAANIAKADLMSEMVGEFPELQGTMGKYYAKMQGKPDDVANAIEEHYKPRFAKDTLPESPEGLAIAISDRLDTLAGFFSLNLQPKKDKDPYGLRRQSLAVARMIIERDINISLSNVFNLASSEFLTDETVDSTAFVNFTFDRVKSWLQGNNVKTTEIDAAAAPGIDNLCEFYQRLQAIQQFSQKEEASELAQANKRVKNILEKNKVDIFSSQEANDSLLELDAEKTLFSALKESEKKIKENLNNQDFNGLIDNLVCLKPSIDSFFENVMVMCDDENVRKNRLNILASIRRLFLSIGDVSIL